jgi:formate dehydrogenase major subunit
MGSNMAENHPVGFQWVVEAQQRGAQVFHVDPRFTRTSALADQHVTLRPGTDIAFLGGVINHILSTGSEFRDYVVAYTNASHIIDGSIELPDDLDGVFSGLSDEGYDDTSWQYEGEGVDDLMAAAGARHRDIAGQGDDAAQPDHQEEGGEAFEGASIEQVGAIDRDPTLEHPRCVFQLLKRQYARYTPEFVAATCGTTPERFLAVAEALCANSGRERTSAIVYSVGWTQHTVGVQYIRAAAIVQLLLGNIGRPGGGILALRGHASIQGSTDIPTLYDLLPGYLPMPKAGVHDDLDTYVDATSAAKGYWANGRAYAVSLLKAWFGEHATADNHYRFSHLPRLTGDHSAYQTALDMLEGKLEGYLLFGENPAVGSANSRLHRLALAHLDWLVVRDLTMIESATFWREGPEIESGELVPEDIGTEVFFLPAAAHVEKDGTFTNTQRLVQWHEKAVEPKGDARSDLWFTFHLGRIIREKLQRRAQDGEVRARDLPLFELTWDYPVEGPLDEPDAAAVLREINGWDADGEPLSTFNDLRDDGSTACGCWIYCGCYQEGVNQTARRTPWTEMDEVAAGWAWAWPDNRRILYNRASAAPDGTPWSERKRYVWWDPDEGRWTGKDTPDFIPDLAPDHEPEDGATGVAALAGDDPFVVQADGKAWLWAPAGLLDGPLPTHYEPHESPVDNQLYGTRSNPLTQRHPHELNPDNPIPDGTTTDPYPYVATTYRIAEHHTAGGMSRFQSRLSELAREMFIEVHPELAAERGLQHGGWATVLTSRTAIEARVLVTRRIAPLEVAGRRLHQVGLPYHWGHGGIASGDAANDLFPIVLDPNVHIQEVKAATCDVVPGRRPRDAGLRALVERHGRDPLAVRHARRSEPRR